MEEVGAENIMDYEVKLSDQSVDIEVLNRHMTRRKSESILAVKSRPLSGKLDRFLRKVIGKIGILHKGTLVIGSRHLKFHK